MKRSWVLGSVALVGAAAWFLPRCGQWLLVDRPEKSDVIVILNGDSNEVRYRRGVELLRAGYARDVLVDASVDYTLYGKTIAQLATDYVRREPGAVAGHVHVCPVRGDSTAEEVRDVVPCLAPFQPRAVLLVTSDFHTRRSYSIVRQRLPQYRWSVAAAYDERDFISPKWWGSRASAKTTFLEWEKLVWWNVVERWRRS